MDHLGIAPRAEGDTDVLRIDLATGRGAGD